MKHTSGSGTRVRLLGRLRTAPADAPDWAEFVAAYGPRVTAWSRAWGLQEADARDVTQDVLLKLSVKLRTFEYDPGRSFRAWLKTVVSRTLSDFADARRRAAVGSGDTGVHERLLAAEAREDLFRRIGEAFDTELLARAMGAVRERVEPRTWEAFRLTAIDGLSGEEAAARLGAKVTAVFVARSRVQKMVREELARLGGDDP